MTKLYIVIFLSLSFFASFAQQSTEGFTFDNEARSYLLYVPTDYNANNEPLPLVIAMHGLGNTKEFFASYNGFHAIAESRKYIIATPQALDPNESINISGVNIALNTLFSNAWNSGAGTDQITIAGQDITLPSPVFLSSTRDDVQFISNMIDTISKNYKINEKRIYASGMSMGGFMSNRLACELSNKIAAIASITGTMGNAIKNSCNPDAIIPVLHIHSTDDETVSYDQNQWGLNAEEMVEFWKTNNNCNSFADTTNLSNVAADSYLSSKILFKDGEFDSEVEFYKLEGPSHAGSWYFNYNDFITSEVIFNFFDRHNKKELDVTSIESSDNLTFDIYPNPSTDFITLNLSQKYELASISIINTLGKTIDKRNLDKEIDKATFNIKKESQGVYFFKIEDNEGNTSVIRFYKK